MKQKYSEAPPTIGFRALLFPGRARRRALRLLVPKREGVWPSVSWRGGLEGEGEGFKFGDGFVFHAHVAVDGVEEERAVQALEGDVGRHALYAQQVETAEFVVGVVVELAYLHAGLFVDDEYRRGAVGVVDAAGGEVWVVVGEGQSAGGQGVERGGELLVGDGGSVPELLEQVEDFEGTTRWLFAGEVHVDDLVLGVVVGDLPVDVDGPVVSRFGPHAGGVRRVGDGSFGGVVLGGDGVVALGIDAELDFFAFALGQGEGSVEVAKAGGVGDFVGSYEGGDFGVVGHLDAAVGCGLVVVFAGGQEHQQREWRAGHPLRRSSEADREPLYHS